MPFDLGSTVVTFGGNLVPLAKAIAKAMNMTQRFGAIAGKSLKLGGGFFKMTAGAIAAPFQLGTRMALGTLKGLGATAGLAFKAVGAIALGAGLGISVALAGAIPLVKLGADLNEMRSKFTAVFQEEEAGAREFAVAFGKGVGRSTIELEGMLANMQALMVPIGFNRKEASKLSQTLVRLAVDLGSFNNISDSDALDKLRSGILGETEPLKALGVVINDTTLSAKLLEMGLAKNAQAATEEQKVMARMQIILDSTKDAQGDAAKTADSLSNSWKGLTGSLFDIASTLGQSLVPGAQAVVGAFKNMASFVEQNQATFMEWGAAISGMMAESVEWGAPMLDWLFQLTETTIQWGATGTSVFSSIAQTIGSILPGFESVRGWVEAIVFAFMNWDLSAQQIGISLAETFTNIMGRGQWLAENLVVAIKWAFDNWKEIGLTVTNYFLTAFKNMAQNVFTFWGALLKAISTGSLKPLTDAFNNSMKGITEGAVSTISQMPEFKPFVATDAFKDQFSELDKEWLKRTEAWQDTFEKNGQKMGETLANGVKKGFDFTKEIKLDKKDFAEGLSGKKAGKEKKTKDKFDLGGAYDLVQKAALGPKDDVPKQQLKAAQDGNKKLDRMVKLLDDKTGQPVTVKLG